MKNLLAIAMMIAAATTGMEQAPPTSPIPRTFMDMTIGAEVIDLNGGSIPWPSDTFGGFRLWDTFTNWGNLEKSRGSYDWSNLDAYLNLAARHNVEVLYTFGAMPRWASSHPTAKCDYFPGGCYAPAKEQDWKAFVTALVNRNLSNYGGRIRAYECWNEANQSEYWSDTIGNLVTMCNEMYTIVHSLQPSAVVLSPSGVGSPNGAADEVNAFFGNTPPGKADAVAFHGYPPCCNMPYPPEDILNIIPPLRTAMSNQKVSSLPIWDTEASWGINSKQLPSDPSGWVARFEVLQWSNGVARHYWYNWNYNWGTLYDGKAHVILPQGLAYQQVEDWLVGNTMTTPCSVTSSNTWTCGLSNGGYQAEIVWNTDGSAQFARDKRYVDYRDLAGGVHPLSGGPVTIGTSPILLETAMRSVKSMGTSGSSEETSAVGFSAEQGSFAKRVPWIACRRDNTAGGSPTACGGDCCRDSRDSPVRYDGNQL